MDTANDAHYREQKKRRFYRIFFPSILVGFVVADMIASTHCYNYFGRPEAFGRPDFYFYSEPVFLSPTGKGLLSWYATFGLHPNPNLSPPALAEISHGFHVSLVFLGVIMAAIGGGMFYGLSRVVAIPEMDTTQGSSRFATVKEIHQYGLTEKEIKGPKVVLGTFQENGKRQFAYYGGPAHIFLCAPSRSGKGVGVIIPTLLTWNESIVVLDFKRENYVNSAGYRKNVLKQNVFEFSPASSREGTARFNPLLEIRKGTMNEISDTQVIARIIMDPDGDADQNDFFFLSGIELVTAAILYVINYEEEKTLNRVAYLLESENILKDMKKFSEKLGADLRKKQGTDSEASLRFAKSVFDKLQGQAQETSTSTIGGATARLQLYKNPAIARNTSASDFRIRDLVSDRNGVDRGPCSLYLVVEVKDWPILKPLFRIVIGQIFTLLMPPLEKDEKGKIINPNLHRILLLLDEFPQMGKMQIIEDSLAICAGYGIMVLVIVQDIPQLKKAYGDNQGVISNCHIQEYFTPQTHETKEFLSQSMGKTTIVKKMDSRSGSLLAGNNSKSVSTQIFQRELYTPDECGRIPANMGVLLYGGGYPIMVNKFMYWKEPEWNSRTEVPYPTASDSFYAEEPKQGLVPSKEEETEGLPGDPGKASLSAENEKKTSAPVRRLVTDNDEYTATLIRSVVAGYSAESAKNNLAAMQKKTENTPKTPDVPEKKESEKTSGVDVPNPLKYVSDQDQEFDPWVQGHVIEES